MSTRTSNVVFFLILVAFAVFATWYYPTLPGEMASHWNARGEVDGYMPKFWALAMLPLVLAILYVLYWGIPKMDPLRVNIETFRRYYNSFWVYTCVFLAYVFALMFAWNLGYRFNFGAFMIPALALLWYVIGDMLVHSKRNWFIGIRTPWTISNDRVWQKTNVLGGRLFQLAGLLDLMGIFFANSEYLFLLVIIPAILIALFSVVYSYVIFRQEAV